MANETDDLESEIARTAEVVEDVDKLVVNLVEWLESYCDGFVEKEPGIAAALSEPEAQEALSDSFEAVLTELDEVEQWGEEDLLLVAAHAILLALTLRGEDDGNLDGREKGRELRGDGDDGADGL